MEDREYSENYLSHDTIVKKAEANWNSKDEKKRIHAGNKYKHVFLKFNLPENDWRNEFSELTQSQKNIIIKGELIRTYDGLSNHCKTSVKRHFGLSSFSTKWFTLPSADKKILLTSILNEEKKLRN
jgi:hypothetical protein